MSLQEVSVSDIHASPFNVRVDYHEDDLRTLGDSIKADGLAQPLKVRERKKGGYELVDGERRLRAMQLVGIETTQVVVEDLTDEQAVTQQWAANENRSDLTDYERAKKLKQLLDVLKISQTELASRIGKSESWLSNHLRMLKLDTQLTPEILNKMTERQARALLTAESSDENDNTLYEASQNLIEYFADEDGQLPSAEEIELLVKSLKPEPEEEDEEPDEEEETEEEELVEQGKAVDEELLYKEKIIPPERFPGENELNKALGITHPDPTEIKKPVNDEYRTAYELQQQNQKAYVIIIGAGDPYGYTLEMRRNNGYPLGVKGSYPNRSTLFDRATDIIGKWNEGAAQEPEAFQKVTRENTYFESSDPKIGLNDICAVDYPKKNEEPEQECERHDGKVPKKGDYYDCWMKDRCPSATLCHERSAETREKERQAGENDQWYKSRASFQELTEGFGAIVNELLTTGRIGKILEVRLSGELPDGTPLYVDLDDNVMRSFTVTTKKDHWSNQDFNLSFEDGDWKRGENKTRIYADRKKRSAINELIEKIMAKSAKVKDLGIPALMTNDEKREILMATGIDHGVEEPSVEVKVIGSAELKIPETEIQTVTDPKKLLEMGLGAPDQGDCLKCGKFQSCETVIGADDCSFTPIKTEEEPQTLQEEEKTTCPHCKQDVPKTQFCLNCGKEIAKTPEPVPEEETEQKPEPKKTAKKSKKTKATKKGGQKKGN